MNILWKLLKQHISPLQLGGFFMANVLGMLILLLSFQFYVDIKDIYSDKEGLFKAEYLIIHKSLSSASSLYGPGSDTFSKDEIAEIREQPFCNNVGEFRASQYRVYASFDLGQNNLLGTDLFFESVPDPYVDIQHDEWVFDSLRGEIPIILPKSYLTIYNFGFAKSKSLPQITESLAGKMKLSVRLSGDKGTRELKAKVIGFSSRINSILVPFDFLQWSNEKLSSRPDAGATRLIMEVDNVANEDIAQFLETHHYEIEDNNVNTAKIVHFFKLLTAIVMSVGLIISLLSIFILMMSIFLLIQKNSEKLRNLILIGYRPQRVALLYQILTFSLNLFVLGFALLGVYWARQQYIRPLWELSPQVGQASMNYTCWLGLSFFLVISLANALVTTSYIKDLSKKTQ